METGATAVVGRGLVEILPDFKKWGAELGTQMKLARTQLDGTAAGLKASAATVGKSMAVVGKGTTALGLGVAAVSVKMAADFQAHTAILQTAAGETSKGLQVVRAGIKDIAVGTGTGIQNLTDGMYTIEKAGYRGSAGLQVLKAAAQGAREENAKLSDVTNAMTSVMASYHLKATDSTRVMNAMKTAAGEGKITMEEFSGALSTVLPIASANKIAFEDVAGSMATLTQHGTTAREATHELAATIRALASPNNVASREMARFGLSAVDVSTHLGQRGLSGTVNLLVQTILSKMGPAGTRLQQVFEGTKQSAQDAQVMLGKMSGDVKDIALQYLKGKISIGDWNSTLKGMDVAHRPMLQNFKVLVDRSRGFSRELKNGGPATQTFTDALKKMSGGAIGLNTILQLTGESAAGNAERIAKVGHSFHNSSKDVEGWKQTSGLLSVQLDRMKAQFQVLAINIGTKLIPVVSAVVGFFAKHRSILLAVAVATGTFIVATSAAYVGMKLYAAGARIATVATGAYNLAMQLGTKYALGTRVQLAALAIQEKAVAVWTAITETAFWGLAAAMLANPVTWIVVGIVALVAAIVLIATKTQWFQKLWGAIWGFIKAPVMGFVHWLKDNWQLVVWTILTGGIGLAVAMIVRHWDGVKHAFSATIDWVKHNWPWLLGALGGPVGLAVVYIVKHWDAVKKGAGDVYHAVTGWFVRMGKDVGGFFEKLPGQLGSFFSKLPGQLGGFFSGLWKSVSGYFSKLPARIASTAAGWDKALESGGKDLISGLFHGASDFFTKSVPGFFKMLWGGIVDFFKAVFGIHSPSTVMSDLGVWLMRGLFGGMLSIASGITRFLDKNVVQPIKGFFTKTIPAAASSMSTKVTGYFRDEYEGILVIWGWIQKHILHPIGNFFTKTIPGWASLMKDQVVSGWHDEYTGLLNIWGWIQKHILNPLGAFFTKTIPGWASGLRDAVVNRWNSLSSGVSDVYNSIRAHVFTPLGNFFTRTIPGWGTSLRNSVVNKWNSLRDGLVGVYSSIQSRVFSPIGNFFTKTIPGWASTMSTKVKQFFSNMRDGIGTIWSGIKDKAKTPINWVLDHVWNNGIVSVWKKITGWIGIGDALGTVKLLAAGGTVGGGPMGVFNKPTAIVGEGGPHPEYVIPTDPKYRARALALWQQAGAHFYAGGGILGGIEHALSSAASSVVNFGKGALDFLTDPIGKAKKLLAGPLGSLSHIGNSPWASMIAKVPHMAVDGLMQAVKKIGSSILGAVGLGGGGGSGVQRWAGVVQMILRQVGQVPALLGITLKRMNQESGGNPTIVNRTDSNWKAGTPSVGLMQVIGPTFRSFAGPYRNVGPFEYGVSVNPAANIYASMKYALSAYGSLASAYGRAGGYMTGTDGATAGWHWLGEDGPELAKLPAGTRIRSSASSARHAPGTPSVIYLTVANHGVIGSRHEVEDWLVATLERLRTQRRLPKALGGTA
ncbi:phage tail tape measure protein [Streptomyces sp. S1D4-14]|uniref:phage tail tape measure protein n=1 Tax=Streptomyces sp. S1D4-14 TaxID=2594461 RepID=UPI001164C8F8|nr:phage tail tape measure protein [Streptomyces sp. S1D4-14]QDN64448.1 phage tail tape measure protein [Streptomyces sp. S1D4-14]